MVVARTGVSIVGPDRSAAAAFFCRGEHRSDSTAGPLPPPGLRAGGICVDGYAVAVRQNLIAQIWRVLECSQMTWIIALLIGTVPSTSRYSWAEWPK